MISSRPTTINVQDLTLESLLEHGRNEIFLATKQRKHPFHTATFSTISNLGPESRTVVLRYAGDWELGFHCDVRSPKIAELKANPRCSWLFYSFPHKLQIRARGVATVHHQNSFSQSAWQSSQLLSRRCYLAPFGPSEVLEQMNHNLPTGLEDREPTEEESVDGEANFCVVRCEVSSWEVLLLDFEGGVRAQYSPTSANWIAP